MLMFHCIRVSNALFLSVLLAVFLASNDPRCSDCAKTPQDFVQTERSRCAIDSVRVEHEIYGDVFCKIALSIDLCVFCGYSSEYLGVFTCNSCAVVRGCAAVL